VRALAGAVVGGLFLAGCASSTTPERAETATTDTEDDLATLEQMGRLTRGWNEDAGRLVVAYEDADVSAEAWVDLANSILPDLAGHAGNINTLSLQIDDTELRQLVRGIAANYNDKLEQFIAVRAAVEAGDVNAERAATARLRAAGQRGQQLAGEVLELLRSRYGADSDNIAAAFDAAAAAPTGPPDPSGTTPSEPDDDDDVDAGYVGLWDATDQLYVEVPQAWSDIDRAPFESNPSILASTDTDAMFDNSASGVFFVALPGGLDHDEVIDDFAPAETCTDEARDHYEDAFYTGTSLTASDCGSGRYNDVILIVAAPETDDVTLVIFIGHDDAAFDEDVLDHILDSFQMVD
jgi:hypothetical protein